MSMSKIKASDVHRRMKNRLNPEERDVLQPRKSIEDVPPEVLTLILGHLSQSETRNVLLSYRLVSSKWKEILGSIIEKKIVGGELQPFPELKKPTHPPAMPWNGGNPFPFNSAALKKNTVITTDYMYFGLILASIGANLTTFALEHQVIHPTALGSLLGAMPNLKLLSLSDVTQTIGCFRRQTSDAALPSGPPLPSLINLKLKFKGMTGRYKIIYLWLICSYAEQLVGLTLDTERPFPAIQRQTEYVRTENGRTIRIGTTSEAAFGKLKELEISCPTRNFLHLSQLPALQRLSVKDLQTSVDFRDLIFLIGNCSQTLENLCLDVYWNYLVDMENSEDQFLISGELPQIAGVVAPKLKTLGICYPESEFEEMMMSSKFLVLFPALETLQFINYSLEYEEEDGPEEVNDGIDKEEDVVTLKDQLVVVTERLVENTRLLFQERQQRAALRLRNIQGGNRFRQTCGFIKILKRLTRHSKAMRTLIFRRLATLGENVEKVDVQLMLKRRGIWDACFNLKTVAVSSEEKPGEDDVCVIRRTDDA